MPSSTTRSAAFASRTLVPTSGAGHEVPAPSDRATVSSRMTPTDDLSTDFFRFLSRTPGITVVCFDFFDTLVYRTVAPEHTKRLASGQLAKIFNQIPSGRDLYRRRRDLEAQLCRHNARQGRDPEFNFLQFTDAFYDKLNHRYSGMPSLLTREKFQDLLPHIEITVELRVQRVFADAARLLRDISKRGLKTAIISDFYLPAVFFQRFLDYHDFSENVDGVFISADTGLTKASGRLYETVLDSLGCPPEQVVMIGDNPHSDTHMAAATGMHVFPVDREAQKAAYETWSRRRPEASRQTARLASDMHDAVRQYGGEFFPEMAVTLWRFTDRLFRQLVQDGVRNVFFFSKEGQFLKTLFEQYQVEQFGTQVLRSHYLVVSRKSTFICSLKPLMEEDFSRIFRQYQELAPRDFLLSLNFSEQEARELCLHIPVTYEKRLKDFHRSDTFVALVGSSEFARCYETKRRYQKRQLLAYIHGFGVDLKKEGFSVVDVGWKGSIQDNLQDALNGEVVVNGYFVGLLQPTHLGPSNRKTGILFSDTPFETPFFRVYNSNRSLFEMLLTATHGSADGYFDPSDISVGDGMNDRGIKGQFLHAGNVAVKTLDLPAERTLFEERIRPIQERFFQVCGRINRHVVVSGALLPDTEWFARRHSRMVYRPSADEVVFFKSLYHLENFGIFEFTDFNTSGTLSLKERMRNLKSVIKDPETVLTSGIWPPIVLSRLGLGFYRHIFGAKCHENTFHDRRSLPGWLRRAGRKLKRFRILPKKSARIAFLIGSAEISGGTYVIFEHAVRMKRMGHQVFLLTQSPVSPDSHAWHPGARDLQWLTLDQAVDRRFDFAIATYWVSALMMQRVAAHTYVYFVQSIESRFFPPDEEATVEEIVWKRIAEKTYLLPLPIITEAHWIQGYLRDTYGHAATVVVNGIRKDIYTESGPCHNPRTPGKLRVLVEGPLGVSYKNVERTIEICRRSSADEVWLLTASAVETYPGADQVFSRVPIEKTPLIYRSCDVLVKLSYLEGMFGPPLEMFHCGGTAIVYDVTGHDEYIRHDVNSLVVSTDDEDAVVSCLNRLKSDPEALERLKAGAREHSQGMAGLAGLVSGVRKRAAKAGQRVPGQPDLSGTDHRPIAAANGRRHR